MDAHLDGIEANEKLEKEEIDARTEEDQEESASSEGGVVSHQNENVATTTRKRKQSGIATEEVENNPEKKARDEGSNAKDDEHDAWLAQMPPGRMSSAVIQILKDVLLQQENK